MPYDNLPSLIRLIRLHQPAGIWLLLWPCWWGVALATQENIDLRILALFAIGAVLMRSAGCIINDITDRKIDCEVERTRNRPLACGAVTLREALLLLLLLLMLSLLVVLQLRIEVFILALLVLPLVFTYPFMKRVTWLPQLFLGLTFNWGALMGWVAVRSDLEIPAILLYAGGVFWTLGYDTIYAHQDKEDDRRIGVKSTALYLEQNSRIWVAAFYGITISCFTAAGITEGADWHYYSGLLLFSLHLLWQVVSVDFSQSQSCMKIFRSNSYAGWILFLPMLLCKA